MEAVISGEQAGGSNVSFEAVCFYLIQPRILNPKASESFTISDAVGKQT